jgi:peroxiredoxin
MKLAHSDSNRLQPVDARSQVADERMGHSRPLSPRSGRTGWLLVLGAAIGILLLTAYGLSSVRPPESTAAPDFTLSFFDGSKISLHELGGRVVVVNFWGSWCPPCREEAPALEKLWREYEARGVSFIGVNINDASDSAMAFIQEYGITYPNGPDPYGRIATAYRVSKVPETFLISREGLITERLIGAVDETYLRDRLNQLVGR